MLFEFLGFLFFISNLLLIAIIVMQKNHGGFWSGPSGGESTMLFGGNQGADVLQKMTWILGAILIIGALSLSIYQSSLSTRSQFYSPEFARLEKDSEESGQEKADIDYISPLEKNSSTELQEDCSDDTRRQGDFVSEDSSDTLDLQGNS
jgi:protein translocase SecG subunit